MAANLYAKSIFGEDALANVSLEKNLGKADAPVTGHIRFYTCFRKELQTSGVVFYGCHSLCIDYLSWTCIKDKSQEPRYGALSWGQDQPDAEVEVIRAATILPF